MFGWHSSRLGPEHLRPTGRQHHHEPQYAGGGGYRHGLALYGKTLVAIGAGEYHSLVLCSDGTLAAWGWNYDGELGDNTTMNRTMPVAVDTGTNSALSGKAVAAIAAGDDHNLALCSDGTLAAWGYNAWGQLGNETNVGCLFNCGSFNQLVPVAVTVALVDAYLGVSALYGKTVMAVAAGSSTSFASCSDGSVAVWGWNPYGQLGSYYAPPAADDISIPVALCTTTNYFGISALSNKTVVTIAAYGEHSVALCSDGTAAAWGNNQFSQIGDGTTTTRYIPVAVKTTPLAASQRFTHLSVGCEAFHTLAVVAGPPASQVILTGAQTLTNGAFQFGFTNTPGAFFGVVATTNPALPLSNWTTLTGLTEVSAGQFQFSDPQAPNGPQRFYRVRSP